MTAETKKCSKKDCENDATSSVHISLRATLKGVDAKSTPVVYVCDDHSDVEWDEVVSQEAWNAILFKFAQAGLMAPKKELSSLEIIPIDTKE